MKIHLKRSGDTANYVPGSALLSALNAAATSLQSSIGSEEEVFKAFREQVVSLGLRGGISILDDTRDLLIVRAVAQPARLREALKYLERLIGIKSEGFSIPFKQVDVYRRVIEGLETVYVPDTSVITTQLTPQTGKLTLASILQVFGRPPGIFAPLISEGRVKGLINMVGNILTEEDVPAMRAFANHIAVALDNTKLVTNLHIAKEDLESAYQATLEGWVNALDLRDNETAGHTERVTEITLVVAKAVGVPDATLANIRHGALLHDIGKMAIPDAILNKPGPLDEWEWQIVRQHPRKAFEWLSQIKYLVPALEIPYCHHEKWDGSGYPQGLVGEAIPLAARIFAVVDVWDAMRSDRPYRNGLSEDEVIQYITEQSGKYFDPAVVDVFLGLLYSGVIER
jgi:hypothetical protein